ncbi:MAG: Ig-like domain-containing protein, partial [Oscillibacter sp.]|nr:Ig-like domain-containing protein [Oscillibacter sp.]
MKKFLRTVSVVLAAVLTVSLTAPAAGAAGFSDTSGHWAKTYIDEGVKAGYLSGYRDGSFRPNASVTRGAFCKMLNKALGLEATASISFKDVSSSDTFYSEIQKAVYAGYISGYDDNTFRADKTITRQEAAVMISRVLPAASAEKNLNTLKDGDSVASYAKSGVRKVLSKGYITGNSSGRFNPASPLTRGQTAKIIRTMLKGERIVRGGVDYTTPGKTYSGNIYVGPLNVNMSSGSLTFSNCKLLGMLTVKSGASVKLSDTDAAVLSVTSSALPTVTATGTSWIRSTYLSGAANLTESGLSGTGFDTVALSGSALKSKTVTLRGAFGAVSASSPVKLALPSGSISLLSVASGAAGSSFALSSGTSVASAVLNGSCAFTGSGTIIAAQQNVSGVTYETAPKTVNGSAAETLVPTVTPSNGATGVSVSASVKLQFSSPVYNSNGGLLTSSKIADSVAELRRGSATGSRVSFAASISSDKKLITLSPESSLQSGVTYYVILLSGSVQTASGTQNTRQVFSFTTGKGALAPTPSPSDGATGVSVTVNPTLTFSESVYDASYSGTRTPGSSVLRKTFLLYRGSVSSSRQVDCSVSISGRRVTVVPDSNLDAGTTYYLVVTEDLLKNSDGDTNSYQKFSFTTTGKGTLVPTPSPSDGATGVSVTVNPTLTFSESVYDASYSGTRTPGSSVLRKTFLLYRGSVSSSRQVDCSVSISGRRVTVVPDSNLDTGTTYYLVVTEDLLK